MTITSVVDIGQLLYAILVTFRRQLLECQEKLGNFIIRRFMSVFWGKDNLLKFNTFLCLISKLGQLECQKQLEYTLCTLKNPSRLKLQLSSLVKRQTSSNLLLSVSEHKFRLIVMLIKKHSNYVQGLKFLVQFEVKLEVVQGYPFHCAKFIEKKILSNTEKKHKTENLNSIS